MIRRKFILLALAFSVAATCGPVVSAQADVTEAAAAAALKITPDKEFIGGQGLHWTGNIGVSGVRTITMQRHLERDGDKWEDVEYFSDETDASGAFAYWYPAPSMKQISYRVVSDTYATPSVVLEALQADLILWVTGDDPDDPADIGSAVANEPFGISVDTTPKLFRRPDTIGLHPIPGRELTLQRRVEGKGDEWDTLDTTEVDDNGMGYFTGVTEREPGEVVYRVRQEDWTKDHSQIGWQPTFPTYVTISAPGVESGPAMTPPVGQTSEAGTDRTGLDSGGTAAQRYGWAPALYDFAWVQGESLTSPPWRGTRRKGWWLDYSDGGGRLSKDNGGLVLDGKRLNDMGPGDFGTTKATLQDNPIKFGRWETKLWPKASENNAEDYQLRLELVPDEAQGDACRTITVAEFKDHGDTVKFGVKAVSTQWKGSEVVGPIDNEMMAFAVEVTKNHITWFLNGDPIGTVTNKKAISKIPMTMRLSMVGNGAREMNRTELKSDWQRGYSLEKGEKVKSGAPLTQTDLVDC